MTKLEELKAAYAAATLGASICYTRNNGAVCQAIMPVEYQRFIALAHNLMPQLLAAVSALEAVKARLDGVFDNVALMHYGALDTSATQDVDRIVTSALKGLK